MKKSIILSLAFVMSIFTFSFAQDAKMAHKGTMSKGETMKTAKTIQLEQTKGVFTVQGLTLAAGTYVFEIANNGVDHEVGFVLAPKGKTDQENHIKEAYVQAPVKNGTTSTSKQVTLAKGEYIYFCPLNPTPQYTLIVK